MATLVSLESMIISIYAETEHDFPHVHVSDASGQPLLAFGIGSRAGWSEGDRTLITKNQETVLHDYLLTYNDELVEAWNKTRNGDPSPKVTLPGVKP